MKNFYLSAILLLTVFCLGAQNPNSSSLLQGSCLNPDEGTVELLFDLNKNCPEDDPNGNLPGTAQMGFHSGVNTWATIVNWDAAGAVTLNNNGADSFMVTINIEDYYGVPFADVQTINMVPNNGALHPDNPWGEGNIMRDTLDGGGFGMDEPCSDLILYMSQTPTCRDLHQQTSLVLFSDAGDTETCVDVEHGLIRIDMDYGLACPEGDPGNILAGKAAIGFHSGANNWANIVAWDATNAVQLVNNGSDNFSAIIDAAAYYGLPFADITDIQMLANNGPNGSPWDNTLQDPKDGGTFGNPSPCSNIALIIAEAPGCDLTATNDITLSRSLIVSPNPFQNRAFLEFKNPQNETFNLVVSDITGRVVRTMQGITGERVIIERENLVGGIYVATLIDATGNFATTKLVVK